MKKLLLVALTCAGALMLGNPSQAQNAYEQGDNILNAGISLGGYSYGYVGARSGGFIPLTASLEHAMTDKLSIGAYAGYASWKYDYSGGKYGWNFYSVGAKGSFHYLPLLNEAIDLGLDEEKIDLYISVLAGLEMRKYSADGTVFDYGNSTFFRLGPVLGGRYMFNPKVGAFFEAGRGALGYGTIGVTARL